MKIRLDPAIKLLWRAEKEVGSVRGGEGGWEELGGAGRGVFLSRVPDIPVEACVWFEPWLRARSSSVGWSPRRQVRG